MLSLLWKENLSTNVFLLCSASPLPALSSSFFAFQKEVKERMEEGRKGGGKEGKRGNDNENENEIEKGEIKEKVKSLL